MESELVLLDTYASDAEAHIVAGLLESEGIPSIIDNQIFASLYPIGFNSIGGLRLMVRATDLRRAREILAARHDS